LIFDILSRTNSSVAVFMIYETLRKVYLKDAAAGISKFMSYSSTRY
jgi:hypothetical protein